ncbi:MAG: trigger factor [Aquificaceae bacterium]
MKVSVKDREGFFKELEVEVEGDMVKSTLDDVYRYLKESVQVEGFRRGQTPLWIIKARYRDRIEEEVGKRVANRTLTSAIEKSKLEPVADIYLEHIKLEEDVPRLKYRVSFEVPPEFELKDVEGMEVEVQRIEFSEELVKERIERLREEHAIWEPVEREVRNGDMVSIEYHIKDVESGETVSGDTSGIVGQGMFREEIDKALVGKREGDRMSFEDLPLYDTSGEQVGRAEVSIAIKGVKEKVLPEVGDDFAKETGLAENWHELEEKIREEVKGSIDRLKRAALEEAVVKKLVELHKFAVPQTLLSREVSQLVKARVSQLSQYGIDTRYLDYRTMAQELVPQATLNIKLRYILEKYAKEKGINVKDEELQKRYEEISKQYGKSLEELKELESIVYQDMLREKALNDIIEKVVVKEVEDKKDE